MTSLGLVETRTIAAGIELADVMVKKAQVELLQAHTICSGRFMILVTGDRASVGEAVAAAKGSTAKLHATHLLSQVSGPVLQALCRPGRQPFTPHDAMAIIECRNVVAGISAADAAVKAAGVNLAKLVCGQGINGKSYFILGGELASVEAGAAAAIELLGTDLLDRTIIPSPDPAVLAAVFTGGRL
jgi:microcompartment protein CcmL/EutN